MINLILVVMVGIITILTIFKLISTSIKHMQIMETMDKTNLILVNELGDVKNHLIKIRTANEQIKNELNKITIKLNK